MSDKDTCYTIYPLEGCRQAIAVFGKDDKMKRKLVLKGHICYSENKRTLKVMESSYLVCQDGISLGVYQELPEQFAGFPVLDYQDRLIIPGLVDLHVHAPQ